jgi:hypothetical protein
MTYDCFRFDILPYGENMSAIDNLTDTIMANSNQLNACDVPRPVTVTITDVLRGPTKEQPVALHITGGYQPWYPCRTVRRILIGAWGENGKSWVGKSATLFCDESVRFGGVAVGGVRVSHLSDINSDMSFSVNLTRGKKGQVSVKKLSVAYYDSAKFDANLPAWLAAIDAGKATADAVIAKVEQAGKLTDEQKQKIRTPAFKSEGAAQ